MFIYDNKMVRELNYTKCTNLCQENQLAYVVCRKIQGFVLWNKIQ
jgi:hypothetical protein